MVKYAIWTWHCIFTKKFRTLEFWPPPTHSLGLGPKKTIPCGKMVLMIIMILYLYWHLWRVGGAVCQLFIVTSQLLMMMMMIIWWGWLWWWSFDEDDNADDDDDDDDDDGVDDDDDYPDEELDNDDVDVDFFGTRSAVTTQRSVMAPAQVLVWQFLWVHAEGSAAPQRTSSDYACYAAVHRSCHQFTQQV